MNCLALVLYHRHTQSLDPSGSHGSVQFVRAHLNQDVDIMSSHGISSHASNSPSNSQGSDPDYLRSHSHTSSSMKGVQKLNK